MSMTDPTTSPAYEASEDFARRMDAEDALVGFRERFLIPPAKNGEPVIYLAGNSLGLQPKSVQQLLNEELEDWATHGVEGHFRGRRPWYSYHEMFRESGARLVGANPGEVVMMNSLTVNLHLMCATFYRPTADRYKIVIEDGAFPSDTYAIKSQLNWHGYDPADGLILLQPRNGEHTIRTEDVLDLLDERGHEIALFVPAGVNFRTGHWFDIASITAAAKKQGCVVGWDLAHAVGNVPLSLHEWDIDFAVWCNYKYMNSGPGAIAGCFVHEQHGRNLELPRFAGWWGNDPDERFKMHLLPEFTPRVGADGWQISNPPIFSLTPVKASIDIFDEATMPALRAKSLKLTGFLRFLLDQWPNDVFEIITPTEPDDHGCQLSILVHDRPKERFAALEEAGVICDFREPNVIRAAPVPLYNSFMDVWRFAKIITDAVR